MTELHYRQCILRKKSGETFLEQTSYIPEPYCKKGMILKLKDDEGTWDDGWEVISAGERTPARIVDMYSQSYKRSRRGSDI